VADRAPEPPPVDEVLTGTFTLFDPLVSVNWSVHELVIEQLADTFVTVKVAGVVRPVGVTVYQFACEPIVNVTSAAVAPLLLVTCTVTTLTPIGKTTELGVTTSV
jgi:hypothetical protein